MTDDKPAKEMYGDGEMPGDADLDTSPASGQDDADDRNPRQPVKDDTADEVADALPGVGRLGGDRPEQGAPLP